MSHHLVEAKDLEYIYPDGTKAVNGISFRITHGESVGIVGANGAGKSTLLLHLIGIHLPTGGSLRVGDFPLTPKTLPQIRRSVGMVFQDPDDQLFMNNVYDDVAFGPRHLGLPTDEVEQRVTEALEIVGAAHLSNKPPYKLSGGEKKAVAIGTVIAMKPDILVMDEPSSGLDPLARRSLINLLKTFTHTKIIASHDLDLVLDLCSRVIVLKEGRVLADGAVETIFQDDRLLGEAHLERPLRMQACPVCNHTAKSYKDNA